MMAIGVSLFALSWLLHILTQNRLEKKVYRHVHDTVAPLVAVFGLTLCFASVIKWLWEVMP